MLLYEIVGPVVALPPAGLIAYGTGQHLRKVYSRADGFATSHTIAKVLSERAVRKTGKVTRPSLSRRHTHPAAAFGRELGRTVRPEGRRRVFASYEQVVGLIAPPRSGKTAHLGNSVIDAPGAAVVTSTKLDIYEHTHLLRRAVGPVWLFNPENMGSVASTFGWTPIQGCEDPYWALRTAAYMVAGGTTTKGLQDSGFWDDQNAKVLRVLLYAAAVGGKTMADLTGWVTNPDDPAPLRILEDHPGCPPGWIKELRQLATTSADKTRESVYLTLQTIFGFMADPAIADALTPDPGGPAFDLRAMVAAGRGTLYLLGEDKTRGGVGPLFAALTGLIFEEAKRVSQADRVGRLDPPLSLILDEAANICPVPLPQWCSDGGGRGIAITYSVQSPAQMESRWNRDGARILADTTNITMLFGGLKDNADLKRYSDMFGMRDEKTPRPFHFKNHRQPPQIRRVPVLDLNEIRELDDFHAILIARNLKPIEIEIRPFWKRRDAKKAKKRPHRIATWTDPDHEPVNDPSTETGSDSAGITTPTTEPAAAVPVIEWTATVPTIPTFKAEVGNSSADLSKNGRGRRRASQDHGLAQVVQLHGPRDTTGTDDDPGGAR